MKDTIIYLDNNQTIRFREMIIQDMKPYLSEATYNALYNNMESFPEKFLQDLYKKLLSIGFDDDYSEIDLPF